MEVIKCVREFRFNGAVLRDPGPAFPPDQVRDYYATLYPEIINAAIRGPTIDGDKAVFEFRQMKK